MEREGESRVSGQVYKIQGPGTKPQSFSTGTLRGPVGSSDAPQASLLELRQPRVLVI